VCVCVCFWVKSLGKKFQYFCHLSLDGFPVSIRPQVGKDLDVLVARVHSGDFIGPTVQRVIEY
jgi:hypothetical protein